MTSTEPAQTAAPAASRTTPTSGILGLGACVPDAVVTNHDLARRVDTSDEWIRTRTGVRERRVVTDGQATSDLAIVAARQALADSGCAAADLDLIVLATITPDQVCPAAACRVQAALGAHRAVAFDLGAACSGFSVALAMADGMVAAGRAQRALVVGADVLSSITDPADRGTLALFGDGAGAVVLGADTDERVLLDHVLGSDGRDADLISVPAGGSAQPASRATVDARRHYLRLDGRQVFRFAVQSLCEMVEQLCSRQGLRPDDLDLLVPHQANLRILTAAAERLGLPMDKVVVTIDRYGNTSSASVPTALAEASAAGRMQRGDLVCTAAFGAGVTWGGALIRW